MVSRTTNTNERLIRLLEVMSRTGKSRSSIYDAVDSGTFPKPVAIGVRSVAWRESEINEWIASCATRPPSPASERGTVTPKKKVG